jgi:CspA family cold shock protein
VSDRSKGRIKWFGHQRGYGFIRRDDGLPDVFVHATDFRDPLDARYVIEGYAVEFAVMLGPKGPRAADVVVLDAG